MCALLGQPDQPKGGERSNLDLLALFIDVDAAGARQWLQTSGISTLSVELAASGDVLERVTLLQDAPDPASGRQELRPHRLRIGLYNFDTDGMLVRTESVETDLSGAAERP